MAQFFPPSVIPLGSLVTLANEVIPAPFRCKKCLVLASIPGERGNSSSDSPFGHDDIYPFAMSSELAIAFLSYQSVTMKRRDRCTTDACEVFLIIVIAATFLAGAGNSWMFS